MSRQIKIIWVLSLISVLLLIGMQGYWLVNQYQYVLNAYSGEIVSLVSQAGEEEYLNRRNDRSLPSTTSYIMRSEADSAIYKYQVVVSNAFKPDSMAADNTFFPPGVHAPLQFQQLRFTSGDAQHEADGADSTAVQFNLNFYTNLTGDVLRSATEKAITNRIRPFDLAQFDSILVSKLFGLAYAVVPWQEDEIYDNIELWKRTGSLFTPGLTISYAYSPLENLGLFIDVKLPAQPVLHRMGIQLIVSAVLTFLLIACLIFQVRTILKQRKVNEIRENFVNTMVHELKRPVQTLKTFVSFLKDEKMRSDAETTEQVVRDSMFELDNLSAYLNKLKDMLQADSETTSLHITSFNLQDLIGKVIRLTHIPPDKEATITSVYETENLYVEADPIHFANVLSNLIENAIKYSGEKVKIEIKAGHDKRKLWVSVKDDGIGIPVTEHDNVFTKFYRADNIPDKNIPGIGLGLSYVRLIIDAHHGSISLNSQAGEGTVVTICLPQ